LCAGRGRRATSRRRLTPPLYKDAPLGCRARVRHPSRLDRRWAAAHARPGRACTGGSQVGRASGNVLGSTPSSATTWLAVGCVRAVAVHRCCWGCSCLRGACARHDPGVERGDDRAVGQVIDGESVVRGGPGFGAEVVGPVRVGGDRGEPRGQQVRVDVVTERLSDVRVGSPSYWWSAPIPTLRYALGRRRAPPAIVLALAQRQIRTSARPLWLERACPYPCALIPPCISSSAAHSLKTARSC